MKSSGLPSCTSTTAPSVTTSVRKPRGAQQRARRQADEGIAAEAFAADHAFQQKAVLAAAAGVSQLQVQRQRGFQVGEGFRDQRNAVVALGAQALEFEFGDHVDSSGAEDSRAAAAAASNLQRSGRRPAAGGKLSERMPATPGPGSPVARPVLARREHGSKSSAASAAGCPWPTAPAPPASSRHACSGSGSGSCRPPCRWAR